MAAADDIITRVLHERFRGAELSDLQRVVVARLLAGESLLLSAPRGWGQNLCWQIAAAVRGGSVLVITPSAGDLPRRAEDLAVRAGLVACYLDAARDPAVGDALCAQIAANMYDVILVSVRQLSDPQVSVAAEATRPSLVVVEEADAATIHGCEYEPATAHIAPLLADLDHPQVLALTEAVDPCALEDIPERLGTRLPRPIIIEPLPPDAHLEVRLMRSPGDADAHLLALLDADPERALVLVSERVEAERLAELIADECELPAEPAQGGSPEFAGALRRFREGGARVLVATGIRGRDARWPEVPLIVQHSLPPSIEHWRRTCLLAGGRNARCVLLCDREERALLESLAWYCAPEPAHLLALHRAVADSRGERLPLSACARLTGLYPEAAHQGLEALIAMGALRVSGRGDDWIAAEAFPPPAVGLAEYAVHADALRRTRLAQIGPVIEFALTRRCRHAWLAEVLCLDGGVTRGCACDRCTPAAKKLRQPRHASTYPLRIEDFRGRALALYRRPGHDAPTDMPARLLHAFKYEHQAEVAPRLAYLMAREVRRRAVFRGCQVIVPVPPTDPADETSPAVALAESLTRLLGWPLERVLISRGERTPQKELPAGVEKQTNVADAFAVVSPGSVRGRVVLLVDDVFDSGATVQAAAKALCAAGARDVRLLTAVRNSGGWRNDI